MTKLTVTDMITLKDVPFPNWQAMALYVIEGAKKDNDYTRYLPSCNDWILDYPQSDETVGDYRARMIEMAIGYQLI